MRTYAITAVSARRVIGVQPVLNALSIMRFHALSAMADREKGGLESDMVVGGKKGKDVGQIAPSYTLQFIRRLGYVHWLSRSPINVTDRYHRYIDLI